VARELLAVSLELDMGVKVSGVVTNANYSRKRGEVILFINDRLVESSAIKRALDAVFADLLPKGGHAFVYLSLEMPRDQVDVNTHPTKAQVTFLREGEICIGLQEGLRKLLTQANSSRTFSMQTRLAIDGGSWVISQEEASDAAGVRGMSFTTSTTTTAMATPFSSSLPSTKKRPEKMVRTDASQEAGSMDKYVIKRAHHGCGHDHDKSREGDEGRGEFSDMQSSSQETIASSMSNMDLDTAGLIVPDSDALALASVHEMLKDLVVNSSQAASDMLRGCVFVGPVDDRFSVVQSGNSLLSVDHIALCRAFFFQRCLFLFGRFCSITIEPALNLTELVGPELTAKLVDKAAILHEYFNIDFRNDAMLRTLPRLVCGFEFAPSAIPRLLRSVAMADWSNESNCLKFICESIAEAMVVLPRHAPIRQGVAVDVIDKGSLLFVLKHVVFPAVRQRFSAPKEFGDVRNALIVHLASTTELYKVFERC